MNESKPTHLDLFSGIGGFSLAAERCGFKTIGFSEIDPYASAVLKKHWPDVPNFGDVRNITRETIGHVDLITGGFPCQPFSLAGARRGDSDERFLWPEIARIMREIRPKAALFENVPGLLSIDGGRTFNRILSDLCEVGYDLLWNCVPASAVGANHQRDRVWIVAYSGSPRGRIQSEPRRECEGSADAFNDGQEGSLANSYGSRQPQQAWIKQERGDRVIDSGQDVADANSPGLGEQRGGQSVPPKLNPTQRTCENTSNPNQLGLSESESQSSEERTTGTSQRACVTGRNWWESEPDVGRVAHGIPNRVDRLKCLGNAIVPQVGEIFLKEIYNLLTPPPPLPALGGKK